MLKQRIITAVVLVCALMFCLSHDHPNYWRGFIGLTTIAAWWEWLGVANMRGSLIKSALYTGILGLLFGSLYSIGFSMPITIGMAVLWIVLLVSTLSPKLQNSPLIWSDTSKAIIGVVVLAYFACGAIWLKEIVGAYGLIALAAIIWIADSGAYFTGKKWGKRKLARTVSPGKSIEGVLGGLALVVFYVVFLYFRLDKSFPLVKSWLKRQAGIKDSGKILPGHGGVLDRIDSLLAALPFMLLAAILLDL